MNNLQNYFKKTTLFSIIFFVFASFASAADLDITLRADSSVVDAGKTLKVRIAFNRSVSKFNAQMLSVDGGHVESMRKLSSLSYLAFVRADENVKQVDILVEAEAVLDLNKNPNPDASNNLIIKVRPANPVNPTPILNPEPTFSNSQISDLLDKVVKSSTPAQPAAPVQSTPNYATGYYFCQGVQIPNSQPCNNTQQQTQNSVYVAPNTVYYDTYGNYYPSGYNNTNTLYIDSGYGYGSYGSYDVYGSGYGSGNSTYGTGYGSSIYTPTVYTSPVYTAPVYTTRPRTYGLFDW
jgi:hypothetical protein